MGPQLTLNDACSVVSRSAVRHPRYTSGFGLPSGAGSGACGDGLPGRGGAAGARPARDRGLTRRLRRCEGPVDQSAFCLFGFESFSSPPVIVGSLASCDDAKTPWMRVVYFSPPLQELLGGARVPFFFGKPLSSFILCVL